MGEFIEVHVDVDKRELLKTIEELQKQIESLEAELEELKSAVSDLEFKGQESDSVPEGTDVLDKFMTQDEITDLIKEIVNDATISIDA